MSTMAERAARLPANPDNFSQDPQEMLWIGTLIQEYCTYRSYALEAMAKHDVVKQLVYESKCEGIYNTLPERARW